jgi:hypothetical protein
MTVARSERKSMWLGQWRSETEIESIAFYMSSGPIIHEKVSLTFDDDQGNPK